MKQGANEIYEWLGFTLDETGGGMSAYTRTLPDGRVAMISNEGEAPEFADDPVVLMIFDTAEAAYAGEEQVVEQFETGTLAATYLRALIQPPSK